MEEARHAGTLAVRILSTKQATNAIANACQVKSMLNVGLAMVSSNLKYQLSTNEMNDEAMSIMKR